MSDFSLEESHPVFPVFLLIDISYSMAGPTMNAVNQALPEMKMAIADDPSVGEIARLGIMTFSDTARSVLPLCDLLYADIPKLTEEGGTNFAEAFRVAKSQIESGVRGLGKGTRFHRPVVFFLSDGFHNSADDWTVPLKELVDRSWKFSPEIVTFGFAQADADQLAKISTRYAFLASSVDPASAVKEILSTLISSIKTTSGSLKSGDGGLIVRADPNQFTVLPMQEVD